MPLAAAAARRAVDTHTVAPPRHVLGLPCLATLSEAETPSVASDKKMKDNDRLTFKHSSSRKTFLTPRTKTPTRKWLTARVDLRATVHNGLALVALLAPHS